MSFVITILKSVYHFFQKLLFRYQVIRTLDISNGGFSGFNFCCFLTLTVETIYSNETYENLFNLYDKKQFWVLGFPVEISFAKLYLQIENTLYLFKSFYTLDFYLAQYFKVFIMFVLIFFVSNLLFGLAYFFSLSTIKDSEKLSQYECGFEPFDEATRYPFDVHFYVVGILFLIFDVEIALLFPWIYSLPLLDWFGFFIMLIFLAILTIGFFYEWHRGALIWPHKKIFTIETKMFPFLTGFNWDFYSYWLDTSELISLW
jgi:NADH-quinone oxidoreductase subunit A